MFVVLILLLILIFLFIMFFIKFTNLKEYNEKLDICLLKIEEMVKFKSASINEILDIIKDEKLSYKFEHLNENFFDKENDLFNLFWDLKKDYSNNKKIKKLLIDIDKNENDLEGLKDFYNSSANAYNDILNKKPYNLFFKLLKHEESALFKSKKIEDYEILKD